MRLFRWIKAVEHPDAAGQASLAVCESLILALKDKGVLSESEVDGLLQDALNTHLNAAASGVEPEMHRRAAALIEEIATGSTVMRGIRRDG